MLETDRGRDTLRATTPIRLAGPWHRPIILAVLVLLAAASAGGQVLASDVAQPAALGGSPTIGPALTTASASSSPLATPGTAAARYDVGPIAIDAQGHVFTSDCGRGAVLEVTSPETARLVVSGRAVADDAFGDGRPAIDGQILCPAGLAFDPQGRLLIADHGHNRIRRIEADGTITTIVGLASPPYVNAGAFAGDGGPANEASLNAPVGLTVDPAGDLYIADRENDRVRKVSADGVISTLAGNGSGTFDGDGKPATAASLDYPLGTAVDPSGDVYIADDNHNRIRMVRPDGIISTVIGDGSVASGGDGGMASDAQINDPHDVVLDADGNLYLSDYGGERIRRIDRQGIVTTIAGTGVEGTAGVDGPALQAQLDHPGDLLLGPDSALYIDDEDSGRILRIDLETGILTLVAGGPEGLTAH